MRAFGPFPLSLTGQNSNRDLEVDPSPGTRVQSRLFFRHRAAVQSVSHHTFYEVNPLLPCVSTGNGTSHGPLINWWRRALHQQPDTSHPTIKAGRRLMVLSSSVHIANIAKTPHQREQCQTPIHEWSDSTWWHHHAQFLLCVLVHSHLWTGAVVYLRVVSA